MTPIPDDAIAIDAGGLWYDIHRSPFSEATEDQRAEIINRAIGKAKRLSSINSDRLYTVMLEDLTLGAFLDGEDVSDDYDLD